MRHVDEYRDRAAVEAVVRRIHATVSRPWTLMEVCGGQTHSILKFGMDELLPQALRLVHGPGCPVCVTPLELIDRALAIASRPEVTFCSFGDMLRVPGSVDDLLKVKARGGDVRIVYSPLDALRLAKEHPQRKVVFFAVGFETTAPANAMAVHRAAAEGVGNFSVLVAHVLVPPALSALLSCEDTLVQGLLAPGHVCAVTGYRDYEPIAERYRIPVVVTGFEPLDLLKGVLAAVTQLERGEALVENQYPRAVVREGNPAALRMIEDVFVVSDRSWRGLGTIPKSGYALAAKYAGFDAERVFDVAGLSVREPEECRAGLVLQGRLRPTDCPEFGTRCTPEHPLGATMVSSEGACAAYFHYRRPARPAAAS
ncbi:MAG TPA: hydrogenase formation protein HypD [Vicinamibacteria bacterium]|nr:hydrogenase formation protein HypD [Vicinamibacteria bacterium]